MHDTLADAKGSYKDCPADQNIYGCWHANHALHCLYPSM